ncbi:MAG: hypothetical protein DRH06_00030 [Deltaproteobacteria bacterium]|nr:MAG: hypothetical protein DRH06_00030 [Deltaproteobacteria bacterium]
MSRYNDPVSNHEEAVADNAKYFSQCNAIYVGVTGDVRVEAADGSIATYVGVPAGKEIAVLAVRILADETTASAFVLMRKTPPKRR